jgi:hypothetical protein
MESEAQQVPKLIGGLCLPIQDMVSRQATTTKVTERSCFTFSIGKHFFESILCGVVETNVYHLILGRTWPCDVDTQHKGLDVVYIVF